MGVKGGQDSDDEVGEVHGLGLRSQWWAEAGA